MWTILVEKIAEIPLSAWFGALTCLAIGLPILGGFCGFAAWRIGDRIADLKEISNRSVTDRLNSSLTETHAKLDDARTAAHAARHFSAFLQEKQAAWILTHEQRERFVAFLEKAPKGRVAVEYVASDGKRSHDFAMGIKSILEGAGYTVWKSLPVIQDTDAPVIGVQVQVKNNQSTVVGKSIQQAFQLIGIETGGLHQTPHNYGEDFVIVLIGMKP